MGSFPIGHTILTSVNAKSDKTNRWVHTIIAGCIFILCLRWKSLTAYSHGQPMHALDNTFILITAYINEIPCTWKVVQTVEHFLEIQDIPN